MTAADTSGEAPIPRELETLFGENTLSQLSMVSRALTHLPTPLERFGYTRPEYELTTARLHMIGLAVCEVAGLENLGQHYRSAAKRELESFNELEAEPHSDNEYLFVFEHIAGYFAGRMERHIPGSVREKISEDLLDAIKDPLTRLNLRRRMVADGYAEYIKGGVKDATDLMEQHDPIDIRTGRLVLERLKLFRGSALLHKRPYEVDEVDQALRQFRAKVEAADVTS